MPTASLTVHPPATTENLFEFDGAVGIALNAGAPAHFHAAGTFVVFLAFTPTATSCSFLLDAGTIAPSNMTQTANKMVGTGLDDALPFHARFFARRKAGTTGAIVAQTVIIKDEGDTVELGRFQVAAAAAGADPVTGWLSLPIITDSRWTMADGEGLVIKVTAVDTDLEIVAAIIGSEAA